MAGAKEQKLIFPGLAGFYATCGEIAYGLLRVVIGYILFMHGWQKFKTGITGVAGSMTRSGLVPGELFAGAAMFLETVGAVCIIVGLFTRFVAAAIAIELGIAFLAVHMAKGFAANQGGFEYVLLLGIVMLAIAIRGGGPYSLDRVIGKEL
jgi:putative oxidoreductase